MIADQPFSPTQRWIELGIAGSETRVVLFRFDQGPQPGGQMNITFWSDDVEATAREMRSKAVEFGKDPEKVPWGRAPIFRDLDGNVFVLSAK